MITASTAFAMMVAGHSHNVAVAVTMDLPGTDPDLSAALASVSVDSATTTDVPTGTRLPVGYPAVSADITLSGPLGPDGVDAVTWFHPYNPVSPLWRQRVVGSPVTVSFGLYPDGSLGVPELIQKFTGFVDSYVVDPIAGTVAFTCIDRRTKLRTSVDLPAVITDAPYNSGLTVEYAMDVILRAASNGAVSTWYPTRAGAVFAAGLRGSVWPDVGAVDASTAASPLPSFAPGGYGTALRDLSPAPGTKPDPLVLSFTLNGSVGDSAFLEALVTWDGITTTKGLDLQLGPSAAGTVKLAFIGGQASNGAGVAMTVSGATTIWNTDVSPGSHYLAALVYWPIGSATCYLTLRLDDTVGPRTALSGNRVAAFTALAFTKAAGVAPNGTWAAVQVTPDVNWPNVDNGAWEPAADLDPSLNHLVAVPATSGDPWQVIQSMADAEQAVAGFEPETGLFTFRNRLSLRSGRPVRDVTSLDSLVSLQISVDLAAYANRVQAQWTGYDIGKPASVYSIDTLIKVGRRSKVVLTPTLDNPVVDLDQSVAVAANGKANPDTATASVYRASADVGGLSAHPGLGIAVVQQGADRLQITLTNNTGQDAWLISPATYTDVTAGTPVLILTGRPVTPADPVTVDVQFPPVNADGSGGAKSNPAGEVLYEVPENVWLQDPDSTTQLVIDTLADLAGARPNLTSVQIVPDPRLQLGDRIRLVDADADIVLYAVIWSQTLSLGSDSGFDYSHTIDVRSLSAPGNWLLGVPGRSELGYTTFI